MNWVAIVGVLIAALGLSSGLAAALARMYARDALSDMNTRMTVIESRFADLRTDVKDNYEYCHKQSHEFRNLLSPIALEVEWMKRLAEHQTRTA